MNSFWDYLIAYLDKMENKIEPNGKTSISNSISHQNVKISVIRLQLSNVYFIPCLFENNCKDASFNNVSLIIYFYLKHLEKILVLKDLEKTE